METAEKLALLGSAARYEIAGERGRRPQRITAHAPRRTVAGAFCTGDTPDGRTGTLLRVLQSSRCEHDCAYCPLRRSNDPARAVFAPEELAGAFAGLHGKGRVDGLLLSSATDGTPDHTMDRMLDTLRILRTHHGYHGYVHLKAVPGVSRGALEEAARLADRVSLNLEVPGPIYLQGLQTGKRWEEDIAQRLQWLYELDCAGAIRSGISSQVLIGVPNGDGMVASDRDLSHAGWMLRARYALRRLHFGDFVPTDGTPLSGAAAPDPRRRARLYQLDWLATAYDYAPAELDAAFDARGHLPLALDPKLAVTLASPREHPIEVNDAPYEELVRVPGIGPISASRIVEYRRSSPLRDLHDLRLIGAVARRAAPFILFNGRRPPEAPAALQQLRRAVRRATEPQPVQLRLWPAGGPI